MVDIMLGVVTPVQKDQSRNSPHRQTLKKKKQDEKRKNTTAGRHKPHQGDRVTLSHGAGGAKHVD